MRGIRLHFRLFVLGGFFADVLMLFVFLFLVSFFFYLLEYRCWRVRVLRWVCMAKAFIYEG